MSEGNYWAVLTAPILESDTVSDGAKLFYAEVSRRTNKLGFCWASNRTLSEELGVCERTITRYVAELESAGFIVTEQVGVSDRKRRHERRIRLANPFPFNLAKNGEIKSSAPFDIDKNVYLNVDKNGDFNVAKNVYHHKENNKSKNNNPPISPQGEERADFFDRFWALYPRKQGKKKAREAWGKLAPSAELCRKMSVALKAQMRSEEWTRDGGRYIPYPSSWLNGRRWEDVVPITTPYSAPRAPVWEEDEFL